MNKRVTIKVVGRVQGVFFRSRTKEKADELGLSGFVRNEGDGSVSIVAEGKKDDLLKLIDFAQNGPEHALVKSAKVTFSVAKGNFSGFEVRRISLFSLFFMI